MRFSLILSALLLAPSVLLAHGKKPHRHHDAHVHGVADAMLVLHVGEGLLELEIPAHDILGFEHDPKTPAQKKALADALSVLKTLDQVLALPPKAQCKAGEATSTRKSHHEHAVLTAQLKFVCAAPQELKELSVRLFDRAKGLTTLRLQVASEGKGTNHNLSASQVKVALP